MPREWIIAILYIVLAFVICAFVLPFIFIGIDLLKRRRKE